MYLSPLLLLFSLEANATGFLKAKGLGEFDAVLRSNDFVLALFGSKWCGNICTMAARAVRDAARMLPPDLTPMYEGTDSDDLDALDEPDNPLVLLRADGSQKVNEAVLQQEDVDDYPAIHFYVRGYKHVFNLNFRTPEFIHPWLIFTISHSPIQLEPSPPTEGSFCAEDRLDPPVGVIAVLKEQTGTLWNMVNDLGDYADTRVYYALDSNRTTEDEALFCTSSGLVVQFPTVRPDDELEDVKMAGRLFLDRHTLERVTVFDPQRVHRYVSGGFPLVVFLLVAVDVESARESLRKFDPASEGLSSISIWDEWVPEIQEIAYARDELRESLWKRLSTDFEIEGVSDILTVIVPRVASSEVGLWRVNNETDQLSPVSEAWELFHGVQVMFNQWYGLSTTSGPTQVLSYDPFTDTKHESMLTEDGSLTDAVADFVVAVVREEVPPLRVSQTAEEAGEAAKEIHPMIEALTGGSISEFMATPSAPTKLHLLLLYAPWCVHCITFIWHVLRPLAEALAASNAVRLFMMDAANNDVPSILSAHSEGYPSFFATEGKVLTSYPMYDTTNMTKVLQWVEANFITIGVSESNHRDEL
ncbi:hypothetical protein FOZ61_010883 [Perkinsus olseni]|uniref:Thioredoxin domain-containing protein n=1 Tax=Perkinsus olseni TaxID=32597 RepID=A0A7J6M310_PEROL|nr:hypothetical protein FOZ61_010883 [Perkinsus olseni]